MFAESNETTDMDELNREKSNTESDIDEAADLEPDSTLGEDTDVDEDEGDDDL